MLGTGKILFNPEDQKFNRSPPNSNSGLPPTEVKKQVEEGQQEAVKDTTKEIEINRQKFDRIIQHTHKSLFTATTVFPFDLFPDFVSIERQQVHVVNREFFNSERRHSIHVQDLSDVFVETSLFFATLKIVDKNYIENLIVVKFLPKDKALKARRIIQGLLVANREQIDLSEFEDEELVTKLDELGSIHNND